MRANVLGAVLAFGLLAVGSVREQGVKDVVPQATLMADLVDAQMQELDWRGIAIDTIYEKPEKDIMKINKVTDKMFRNHPSPVKQAEIRELL